MINPYHYGKTKHRRTRTPPAYRNYKQYKPELRLEFSGQCVYCRAVDHIKGVEAFGVDHYRPQSVFRDLATEYLNLFYACNRCNSLKRQYWPDAKDRRNDVFIPNPCEHVMFDHLRYSRGDVSPNSNAGAFTVDRLDLNDPSVVEFRNGLITTLAKLATEEREAADLVTRAESKKRSALGKEENEDADQILEMALRNHARAKEVFRQLLGPLVATT